MSLGFKRLTSTCFEQAYCSSSGGTILYTQQLVYVMRLCCLAVGRIGKELHFIFKLKVNSASCWFLTYGYITMHGQQNIKGAINVASSPDILNNDHRLRPKDTQSFGEWICLRNALNFWSQKATSVISVSPDYLCIELTILTR